MERKGKKRVGEGRGGQERRGEGSHRVPFAEQLAGLGQVHLVLLEAVQSALHQQLLLLVVLDQLVPERVLGRGDVHVANTYSPLPCGC